MQLDNRQLAIAAWILVGLIWTLKNREMRPSLLALLGALAAWRMALTWAFMAAYIALEVNVLSLVGLWNQSHLIDTLIWAVTVAAVLFVQLAQKTTASFKEAALQIFNVTLILDFLVNLHVFGLLVELLLVPFLFLLAGLLAVSQTKEEYRSVERMLNTVMAILGSLLLLYASYSIYSDWPSFFTVETGRRFLVPLALSLLFMPFIYVGMLYSSYERFLARLQFYVKPPLLKRFKRQAILRTHLSLSTLEAYQERIRGNQINVEADLVGFFGSAPKLRAWPPDGYRSMKWGDPPSDDMRLYSSTTSDNLSLYKPAEYEAFLGLPIADELYGFSNGKLYEGMVWFHGEDRLHEARRRLSATYGPPSFANEYGRIWKWKWPGNSTEIHLTFNAKDDVASALFINDGAEGIGSQGSTSSPSVAS